MLIGIWMTAASAAYLDYWSQDDFGNASSLSRVGWETGYSGDSWSASNGRAYSESDDNVSDDGDNAKLNWAIPIPSELPEISPGEGDQVMVSLEFQNEDDDSFGLVSHHDGEDSFYILLYTEDNCPPPGDCDRSRAILYRVEGGEFMVLDYANTDLNTDRGVTLSLTMDDGTLTARAEDQLLFEVEDLSPLGPGLAGFYAYDSGGDRGDRTDAWADQITVQWVDEDDDGVADDVDNCEEQANPGQEDGDGDGIGDACDEDGGDGDGDGDGQADSADPDDGGEDSAPPVLPGGEEEEEDGSGGADSVYDDGYSIEDASALELKSACGCAGGGLGWTSLWFLGAVAGFRRRSR